MGNQNDLFEGLAMTAAENASKTAGGTGAGAAPASATRASASTTNRSVRVRLNPMPVPMILRGVKGVRAISKIAGHGPRFGAGGRRQRKGPARRGAGRA